MGLRSRRGASFRVLSLVGTGALTHCLSVPLLFEYEDVLKRPGVVPLSGKAVEDVLDGLCATAERRPLYFLWRPQLADAADGIVDLLNAHHQRATYGAVSDLLGLVPRSLLQGRKRDRRHSWIVNQETGLPTGYQDFMMHPALLESDRVLATEDELRVWLAGRTEAISQEPSV